MSKNKPYVYNSKLGVLEYKAIKADKESILKSRVKISDDWKKKNCIHINSEPNPVFTEAHNEWAGIEFFEGKDFSIKEGMAYLLLMYTPKEKAKELFDKYTLCMFKDDPYKKEYSKECSIICVDEMLNELNHHSDLQGYYQNDEGRQSIIERISYWRKVKYEIEIY
jgi:hypothetical protein